MPFLPICREDMEKRGWNDLDFLYISGDAYVDHPSFGHSIITRILEREGFKVGIIAQPDWNSSGDFTRIGRPRYAVFVSSGVIDSMVNHYTANKRRRSSDSYSPGGRSGCRPDRAVIVYCNKAREVFKGLPVIIGGTEASLRRFAHYDYWDNTVRRTILQDSKADLLIYGMGEKPVAEIARLLSQGHDINDIKNIRGTAYLSGVNGLPDRLAGFLTHDLTEDSADVRKDTPADTPRNSPITGNPDIVEIPSYEDVASDKKQYCRAFMLQYNEQDAYSGKILLQKHGDRYLVQNPPSYPLSEKEMDSVYALPFERTYHPVYEKDGGIPALNEVEFSITSHRGCLGECSFCSINFHQGRIIQKRSRGSVVDEAVKLSHLPGFKGYIHDVGGPTANFRNAACGKRKGGGMCKGRHCLFPKVCENLKIDHGEYLELLRSLRRIPGVKKVFIRSGIRYDYLMKDKNEDFFKELCKYHISGQLKVAPEHVSGRVLELMGKPGKEVYESFAGKFREINKKIGKEQYLIPYLISSHPGSDLNAAVELAQYLNETGFTPEQVQDFYPTPGTLSTCMFYTGLDPRNMKPVYVPVSPDEKAMQRALLQYRNRENRATVRKALVKAGREDLIGYGKKCLVRPTPH